MRCVWQTRNYICVALWREGKIALKVAICNSIIPCIVIVKVLSTMIRGKINQKIKYNWKDWLLMTTCYCHNAIFSQRYNGLFWPTFIFWHIHIVLMDCLCYKEQIVVIYIYNYRSNQHVLYLQCYKSCDTDRDRNCTNPIYWYNDNLISSEMWQISIYHNTCTTEDFVSTAS